MLCSIDLLGAQPVKSIGRVLKCCIVNGSHEIALLTFITEILRLSPIEHFFIAILVVGIEQPEVVEIVEGFVVWLEGKLQVEMLSMDICQDDVVDDGLGGCVHVQYFILKIDIVVELEVTQYFVVVEQN